MVTSQPSGTPDHRQATFQPLVQLLEQELAVIGNSRPQPPGASLGEFTRYYLEVVQLLEAQVAGDSAQLPMSRAEVEMQCRCALSGSNLGEAIELCRRFSAMLSPRAGHLDLKVSEDTVTFYLDSLRPETTTASSLVDITGLFAFQQLFRWLVGIELPLRQVGIGSIQRDDMLPFLKLFKTPVLTGGNNYSLEFNRDALDLPVVRRQSEFARFFTVFPCGVFELTANALPQQVSALLYAAARAGGGMPTQRALASSLDLPFSTFRRRLAEAGGSFRHLRETCLKELAQEMLGQGEMSIGDIAAHLGFGDAAAFRRAFVRWSGASPSAWRQRQFVHA